MQESSSCLKIVKCVGRGVFIKAYVCTRSFSSSLNHHRHSPSPQRPDPLPTRVIAAKPLCQFMSAWEAIPRISRWLLCIRARVHPSIQTQTTPFQWRGVVSNTDSKCPYPKQELIQLLGEGAIEQFQRAGGTAVCPASVWGA